MSSSSYGKLPVPRREGVEEKKEDDEDDALAVSPRLSRSEENVEQERRHGFQAQVENFASVVFGSCGTVMEAASLFVERQSCSRWKSADAAQSPNAATPIQHQPPPLSIADELRKLAEKEGRPFPAPPAAGPRAAGIPKYLGEDAVQSFEDDNISAISAHTLEEMARNGIVHPVSQRMRQHREQHQREQEKQKSIAQQEQKQKQEPEAEPEKEQEPEPEPEKEQEEEQPLQKEHQRPPSPTRTTSLSSTSSSKERRKRPPSRADV